MSSILLLAVIFIMVGAMLLVVLDNNSKVEQNKSILERLLHYLQNKNVSGSLVPPEILANLK